MTDTRPYLLEQIDDAAVVQLYADGFDKLTLKEKTLVWHLCRAAIAGRDHASIEDVRAIAMPVLRHRIITNYAAEQEGMTSDVIIARMLKEIDPSAGVGAGLPGVKAKS